MIERIWLVTKDWEYCVIMAPVSDDEYNDSSDRKCGFCGKNTVKKAVFCTMCKVTYHVNCSSKKLVWKRISKFEDTIIAVNKNKILRRQFPN